MIKWEIGFNFRFAFIPFFLKIKDTVWLFEGRPEVKGFYSLNGEICETMVTVRTNSDVIFYKGCIFQPLKRI